MDTSSVTKWAQLAKDFLGSDFFNEIVGDNSQQSDDRLNSFGADIFHETDKVIVLIGIPGMKKIDSATWEINGDRLIVKGTCPEIYPNLKVHESTRSKGEFKQEFSLGTRVKTKHTYARYYRGLLELHFPYDKD